MEAKFKVGDKVTVIDYPRDCPFSLTPEMLVDHGGRTYTVSSVIEPPFEAFTRTGDKYPEWDQHKYFLSDVDGEILLLEWSNMMFVDGDVKPAITGDDSGLDLSFTPIYYQGSATSGQVTFIRGSMTVVYIPYSKSQGHFWSTSQSNNDFIFEWLGLDDLAKGIATLATGTEHAHTLGCWPYSTSKADNVVVMDHVISLVKEYNKLRSKDKLRANVLARLTSSKGRIQYESNLSLTEVKFTKDDITLEYSFEGSFYNCKGYPNNIIFKWLGINDIKHQLVDYWVCPKKADGGDWPETVSPEDTKQVMRQVLRLCNRYNNDGGQKAVRDYCETLISPGVKAISPASEVHIHDSLNGDFIPYSPDQAIQWKCKPVPVTYYSMDEGTPVKGHVRPADREVRLSINKHRTYKVKSR